MQIAICRVMGGQVRSFCIDPPRAFKELTTLGAEGHEDFLYDILYAVTQEERWLRREPSLGEALDIFKTGHYENAETGVRINLKLPGQFQA
jgi:hypothetical protein